MINIFLLFYGIILIITEIILVMLEFIIKKLNKYFSRMGDPQLNKDINEIQKSRITKKLEHNIKNIGIVTENASDVIIRRFIIGREMTDAAIISVDGLINNDLVAQNIMKPLMYDDFERCEFKLNSIEDIKNHFVTMSEVKIAGTVEEVINGILSGDTALIVNGFEDALIINTKGYALRTIQDPQTESVIRGPREGFIENLRTNTALMRRKIKDPALKIKNVIVGRKTKTTVAVLYMDNIADQKLIDNILNKLGKIDTDAILESGYIEQLIESKNSPFFPVISNTEKPDVLAGKILEGRVGILVDGSPYALTMPTYFTENFQTAEDYYISPIFSSILRFIRFTAFLISLFTLPFYVTLTTFHQELIPTSLLFTMASSASGTPFPTVIEAVLMILTFEILKEAGVRMPRPVGQAVSMVGAIIISETAISAGLISSPMAIAVAITAVSAYAVPSLSSVSSMLRIIFIFLSGIAGGYGLTLGVLGLLIHLSSIRSFGMPYLTPFSPFKSGDIKDSLIRLPHWALLTRPQFLSGKNPRRAKYENGQKGDNS